MFRDTHQVLLTAMSVCAACALMATPAFADDDKRGGGRAGGGGGGDDHRGRVTTTTTTTTSVQRGDDRGRGDDKPLVNAAPQAVQVRVEHEAEHQTLPAVVTTVVDNRGPGNAFGRREHDAEDENENVVAVATVNDLVAAINNEVAALTNANVAIEIEDQDEVNEVEVEHLQVINLATLTAGLSATDAATVTNAVNANTAALQSFLGSGGTNANAIDNALNALGVAPSSVLAIVSNGEQLIAVTA